MRFFMIAVALCIFARDASAADSRALSEERRKLFESISFYCPIGRIPINSSGSALAVSSPDHCSFSGPLDTKISSRFLEPPVVNPELTMDRLQNMLIKAGLPSDRGNPPSEIRFQIPSGASFIAQTVSNREMLDPLFQYSAYPQAWGQRFVRISSEVQGTLPLLVDFANTSLTDLFWDNPHYPEESKVLPRLTGTRNYLPLNLLSKCGDGHEWKTFGGARSLLLVGDMHSGNETRKMEEIIKARDFAWVGLEINQSSEQALKDFLAATDSSVEELNLALLTARNSRDTVQPIRSLLKTLKSRHAKIILIDSEESYFNFPFTNISFHGLMMATRNWIWVNHLPSDWHGTAALLGGLDHFAVTPNADFQNFAQERFPGLDMGLINPLEVCKQKNSEPSTSTLRVRNSSP